MMGSQYPADHDLGQALLTCRSSSEFLALSRQHTDQYSIPFLGKMLLVDPGVCSPLYTDSGRFVIRNWDLVPEHRVLDMGTGTGLIAIAAALIAKCRFVVATDLSHAAVENAQSNVFHFELQHVIDVREGDLFAPIRTEEVFDRIIFNPPYEDGKVSALLDWAVFDPGYRVMKGFLATAQHHLSRDGKILVNFTNLGDVERLETDIVFNGYQFHRLEEQSPSVSRLLYILEVQEAKP